MEVYKQASEGKFKLTDWRWIDKQQQVGGSGVLQELGDHSSQLSLHDLGVLMIVLSDNTATNMLIDLVGMENVNIPVAFKPGGIAGASTEGAIVYLKERPYVVVVMENYEMGDEATTAMKEVSRTLYDYFWRLGNATRYGTYVEPALIK